MSGPTTGWARRLGGPVLALAGALAVVLAFAPVVVGPILPTGSATAAPSPTPDDNLPHGPSEGASGGRATPPRLVALPAEIGTELQAAVNRARTAFGLNVLVVGVAVDNAYGWSGGAGTAPDGATKLIGDDPFAIASVTKTFTATLVLQLAEERKLGLDDPVSRYLPDVPQVDGVTIRELLSHTSGIPDLLNPMRSALNANPKRIWTPTEVMAYIGQPTFVPGSDWAYSNTNFVLLGMVVEAVTGHPFAEELGRRIIDPLELAHTGMLATPGAPWLFSESWESAFSTAGGMYSSADDLLRWGEALYGGWMIGPDGLGAMLTFNNENYGLGAEQYDLGDRTGYGHSGLLRGFTTLLVRLPTDNIVISLVATNRLFKPTDLLAWSANGQPSILDLARQAVATH